MGRKSKVVGFSLPPEIHQRLERTIKQKHKTRSEFFRGIIDLYFQSLQPPAAPASTELKETDLAKILESYWLLKSQSKTKIIVIGLAIITNYKNKVLIGARKAKDPWVENLTWVFPGGKLDSFDFEKGIKKEAKQETNLKIEVKNLIAARIHPDSGFKPVQIIALYFHCATIGNQKLKPGGDLAKLKWVKPTEVFKYFTTSTCDEVTKFLVTIEKANQRSTTRA